MSGEVARPTLSDALTEQILELIRADGLRPGDRLPPPVSCHSVSR